jgi:hypothetical protein|tara:strand:- start:140 stop:361 length:222 start_codon:yes stop_codon:yes gene_type:complete
MKNRKIKDLTTDETINNLSRANYLQAEAMQRLSGNIVRLSDITRDLYEEVEKSKAKRNGKGAFGFTDSLKHKE